MGVLTWVRRRRLDNQQRGQRRTRRRPVKPSKSSTLRSRTNSKAVGFSLASLLAQARQAGATATFWKAKNSNFTRGNSRKRKISDQTRQGHGLAFARNQHYVAGR